MAAKTTSTWSQCLKFVIAPALAMLVAAPTYGALVITEIMYDPAGGNEHEYVEIFNNGASDVDLTGYILEDSTAVATTLTGGTVPAGGTAVIIRIDTSRLLANYEAAWGAGVNWVETTFNTWPNYTNTGDSVILRDPSTAIVAQVDYGVGNGFPASNDSASIYMLNPNGPQNAPSNWALSVVGVDGAVQGLSPRASDVGSPGFVVPEPASIALASLSLLVLVRRRR